MDAERIELRIVGKRNKQRMLYIDNGALAYLRDWLAVRGNEGGALYVLILKSGLIVRDRAMSTTALDQVLVKRCEQAGVEDMDCHDLRRTLASNLLDAEVDISIVSGLMGHSNVQTTVRYDRRPAEARRRAVSEHIHVPHHKRRA